MLQVSNVEKMSLNILKGLKIPGFIVNMMKQLPAIKSCFTSDEHRF